MTDSEPNRPEQQPHGGKTEQVNHFAHVVGHVFGFLYILVTLLFGPVKSVANWLAQQSLIQKYKTFIAGLPPALGLMVSVLSLGLLELSKLAVLFAYQRGGLLVALCTTLMAKLSFGYLAHTTWHAARPKVIEAYPRVRTVDAWVGRQIAIIKGFRDRIVAQVRAAAWYPALVRCAAAVRQAAVIILGWFKGSAKEAGKSPEA